VVFSEPVTGFTTGEVTLGGTAGATTATVSGSGATYNVAVTGMTSWGTVIASIGAGVCQDPASNGNAASTSADNTNPVFDPDDCAHTNRDTTDYSRRLLPYQPRRTNITER
jgi:hypothetical protein